MKTTMTLALLGILLVACSGGGGTTGPATGTTTSPGTGTDKGKGKQETEKPDDDEPENDDMPPVPGTKPGSPGTSNPPPSGKPIGGECQSDSVCASEICVRRGGASYGYCSIVCESFSDCPSFWNCEKLANASQTYCVKD